MLMEIERDVDENESAARFSLYTRHTDSVDIIAIRRQFVVVRRRREFAVIAMRSVSLSLPSSMPEHGRGRGRKAPREL